MGGEYSTPNYLDRILQDRCSEPRSLPIEDLRKITNNFSDDKLLGEGGFGKVYKGVLPTGEMIAVKKLVSSMPGVLNKQFENEAHHLMRLKHPNIVQLVGYCSETENILVQHNGRYVYAERSERLLCLEYLPKGNLCRHLTGECSGLDWDTRYKIIEGICYGLHYLHEEWQINTPIIHMDLKPANILLGDNMVPKIADFGLSRLFGKDKTRTCTQSRDGTLGYMAPEYINRGIISKKLDIFSLGVIIIEIITGYKDYPDETGTSSQEYIELVLKNWRSRLENAPGYISQRIDYLQIRRCIEIGLSCVKLDRKERPTTGQIIKMLRGSESADFSFGDAVIQHLANTSGAKRTYMSLEKDGQPKRRCLGIDLNHVEADTMEQSEKNFVDLRLWPSASQEGERRDDGDGGGGADVSDVRSSFRLERDVMFRHVAPRGLEYRTDTGIEVQSCDKEMEEATESLCSALPSGPVYIDPLPSLVGLPSVAQTPPRPGSGRGFFSNAISKAIGEYLHH